jgi:NAD(P) transhydrogenase
VKPLPTDGKPWDLLVIGSGPAGQKAAVQAAKAGKRVVVVEQERSVGGACVHFGTIPSKALREQALRHRDRGAKAEVTSLAELLGAVASTVAAHDSYMGQQLDRNGITLLRGRARLLNGACAQITLTDGTVQLIDANRILVASGSRPRAPANLAIDHENILDSDSILSLGYLPRTLLVLGGGVIASEYAASFAALGSRVIQADRAPRPLGFIDADVSQFYMDELVRNGGSYWGEESIESLAFDGVCAVAARFKSGRAINVEKVLVALGRVANVETLGLDAAGVALTSRGDIAVDAHFRTSNPRIFAAGDVIGPPALASTAMEQGRRAACYALDIPATHAPLGELPAGIYTIPEMASVGLDEANTVKRYGGAIVGRARFKEIARGLLCGGRDGLLKMIAAPDGATVVGVQIVGDSATELIHIGQMGLAARADVDTYVDNVFNFPTMAEAYRVAALDIVRQRGAALPLERRSALHAHA